MLFMKHVNSLLFVMSMMPEVLYKNTTSHHDHKTPPPAAEADATKGRTLQFNTTLHFDLMSSARWRFQWTMEQNLERTAKMFGDDSEEMLQMRDLFANTSATLLICTMVVSFLHMIFEFLAFKSDVQFWKAQSPEMLNKYVSVGELLESRGKIVVSFLRSPRGQHHRDKNIFRRQ